MAPLGAHVSIAGGLDRAIERGRAIGATALQIFTKAPQRWAERPLSEEEVRRFRGARAKVGIQCVAAHDSYLINLASPDRTLFRRSLRAFQAELVRAERLGLEGLVTHPGNATDGNRRAGLARNARAIAETLERCPGDVQVWVETTAGSGTALGARFEELAELLAKIPVGVRDRVAVCFDTAHAYAAGYDLREDYDGVWTLFDTAVGVSRIAFFHLNDSQGALGSRVDRHADIGCGELGERPFARLMRDPRFRCVPRVIETPKGAEPTAADRRNLERLRRLARGSS